MTDMTKKSTCFGTRVPSSGPLSGQRNTSILHRADQHTSHVASGRYLFGSRRSR